MYEYSDIYIYTVYSYKNIYTAALRFELRDDKLSQCPHC